MILIVDGANLAFAANMTRELSTSYGTPTHAIIGFLRTLGNVCERFEATAIHVAWDGGRSLQRLGVYPDYKGARKTLQKDPEWVRRRKALDKQIGIIRPLLSSLGVTQVWGDNLEGDDIIALIVKFGRQTPHRVIVSADKDFWQLVEPTVSCYNPINNGSKVKHVTEDNFTDVTGLMPSQYLDFKAMVGDPSDSIPGCRGVGEKTALKIINAWGSYEAFYDKVAFRKYIPTTLERRAIEDHAGFKMAKWLMDLKAPLHADAENVQANSGQRDLSLFKKTMVDLEIRTTDSILESYKSFLEVKDER